MTEYIDRQKIGLTDFEIIMCGDNYKEAFKLLLEKIEKLPVADVQPVVRCKDCKHFHLDYFGEVNGANIIVAHEICDLWAGGCKTTQDTFCSNGVRKYGEA